MGPIKRGEILCMCSNYADPVFIDHAVTRAGKQYFEVYGSRYSQTRPQNCPWKRTRWEALAFAYNRAGETLVRARRDLEEAQARIKSLEALIDQESIR